MTAKPHLLIIAGTDPTGGAGISRDIETAAHFNVKTALTVTAVNVQTDQAVSHVTTMSADYVKAQIEAALSANAIKAVKIGMLGTADIARAVATALKAHTDLFVVLDPVLKASSGGLLASDDLCAAILDDVLKHITLLTPNRMELARLTDRPLATNDEEAITQARQLIEKGVPFLLVKGGHSHGDEAVDYLVSKNDVKPFYAPRLQADMRGTGCTLSSAIAANMVLGQSLEEAVSKAKAYVFSLLQQQI